MTNFLSHRCEITLQISTTEDTITGLTNRIRGLEDALDCRDLPEGKRTEVEEELLEIKNQVDKNKELLSKLHKENTRSFVAAACIAFLLFLVYLVYTMTTIDR